MRNYSLLEIRDNKLGKLEHTGVGREAAAETRGVFGSKAHSKERRVRNRSQYLWKTLRRRGGLHNGRNWGKELRSIQTHRGPQ